MRDIMAKNKQLQKLLTLRQIRLEYYKCDDKIKFTKQIRKKYRKL